MRLFIAFEVSEEAKQHFLDLQKQMPNSAAVMTFPKDFHQTLKFLGEVPDDKFEFVKDLFSKIKFAPFEANIEGIGVFPNESRINVVWVGIGPKNKIVELQQNVEKLFSDAFGKEERFLPHVTICRVKAVRDKTLLDDAIKKLKPEQIKFAVSSIKLIKSTLLKEGPVYETVAELS